MRLLQTFVLFCGLISLANAQGVSPAVKASPVVDEFVMDFIDVNPRELIRLVYGGFLRESYMIDGSVDDLKPVTLKLRGMTYKSAESLLVDLLKNQGVEVRQFAGVRVIGRRDESREDKETVIYRPKYRSSSYLQQAMASVFPGGAFPSQRPGGIPFAALGAGSAGQGAGAMDARSRSSSGFSSMPSGAYSGLNTMTELETDVLVFLGSPAEVKRFNSLVASLDQPQGEVMVKAVVYEVRHEQKEGSAIDLALSLLSGKFGVSFTAGVVGSSGLTARITSG